MYLLIEVIRGLNKNNKLLNNFIVAVYNLKVPKAVYNILLYIRI